MLPHSFIVQRSPRIRGKKPYFPWRKCRPGVDLGWWAAVRFLTASSWRGAGRGAWISRAGGGVAGLETRMRPSLRNLRILAVGRPVASEADSSWAPGLPLRYSLRRSNSLSSPARHSRHRPLPRWALPHSGQLFRFILAPEKKNSTTLRCRTNGLHQESCLLS